jgi:Ni/Fe-hydrogenase subunit HybB-like protein
MARDSRKVQMASGFLLEKLARRAETQMFVLSLLCLLVAVAVQTQSGGVSTAERSNPSKFSSRPITAGGFVEGAQPVSVT